MNVRHRLAKLEAQLQPASSFTAAQRTALLQSVDTFGIAWDFDEAFNVAFMRRTLIATANPRILRRRTYIALPAGNAL